MLREIVECNSRFCRKFSKEIFFYLLHRQAKFCRSPFVFKRRLTKPSRNRKAYWYAQQAMFMKDWKQTAQRLQLQERLLTINTTNIIRWTIYTKQQFLFTKTSINVFLKVAFLLSKLFRIWTIQIVWTFVLPGTKIWNWSSCLLHWSSSQFQHIVFYFLPLN